MKFENYKEKMLERYARNFDVKEDYKYNDWDFDIFSILNVKNEKYFGAKSIKVYTFENDEYVFLKYFKSFNEESLDKFIDILKKAIEDYVDPHEDHMSSAITGVIAVDKIDDTNLIKQIKEFKYQKGFLLGFKGWADIRLILVDLSKDNVITSKKAKKVGKFYQP